MALIFSELGDNAPNFVEPGNNPKAAPWLTDYTRTTAKSTITIGPTTIRPAAKKTKAAAAATPRNTLSRRPAWLDGILPLRVDDNGKKTIYGMPPALVYIAGGVLTASLLALIFRVLGGGWLHATNPKRAARAPSSARRRRAKR